MKQLISLSLLAAVLLLAGCASRQTVKVMEVKGDGFGEGRITFSDGSGDTFEDAVVIVGARSQREVVAAEYEWISRKHGPKGKAWKVAGQVLTREGSKLYDNIEIRMIDSEAQYFYYFDISKTGWKPRK